MPIDVKAFNAAYRALYDRVDGSLRDAIKAYEDAKASATTTDAGGTKWDFTGESAKQPVGVSASVLDELVRIYDSAYNVAKAMNLNLLSLTQRREVWHREALNAVWSDAYNRGLEVEPLKREAAQPVEYRPHPNTSLEVRIRNALHALNLTRPDISALKDGQSIVCNITDCRSIGALLEDIQTHLKREPAQPVSVTGHVFEAWESYAEEKNINLTVREMLVSGKVTYEHLFTDGCFEAFIAGFRLGGGAPKRESGDELEKWKFIAETFMQADDARTIGGVKKMILAACESEKQRRRGTDI